MFDLDKENNLPTWFSSFILLNNAFFLYIRTQSSGRKHKLYWIALSLGFLILAVDEVASIHETINAITKINWAIPGLVFVVLLGIVFVPFLLSIERKIGILFLLSGVIYISGALGIELASIHITDFLNYRMIVAVEEGLEMLGALLFLWTNLRGMSENNIFSIEAP